ncbi:MAG: nucleotidyltransferase domain-containing protein [Spirochaetota bacterium]|nr:nucleotidyltransferase domain-containing protein [Spirochaetota bacterium]
MIHQEDIIHFLQENQDYFKSHFRITKIALFGSFARNEELEDSDIDLIVEFEENTKQLFEIKQELREFLGHEFQRKVDIAREKYLKPSVKQEILKEAITIE